jgi:hypothetical protein
MQDLTIYYLFLKCNLMHYYFDKILLFVKSGCYTRIQAPSQDNGSHLPAGGSSDAAMCPHGSGNRSWLGAAPGPPRAPRLRAAPEPPCAPAARGSFGAATCHLGASTHILVQNSSGAATRHLGSVGCKQINKYPLVTRPS